MEGLWLAASFMLTSFLAGTAVPSLPLPFAYMPVLLIGGILVMNRVNVVHGALWLVMSSMVMESLGTAPGRFFAYLFAAAVGVVLAERVFAKRSVYALLGLGISTGTVFVLCEWLHRRLALLLHHERTVGMSGAEAWWTLVLLLVGLYLGFIVIVTFRRWIRTTFVIR